MADIDADIQPYQSPDPDDVEIQRPKKTYKRQARPRTLWTDKETADLRRGVELYGAGNWKRILNDKNFHFNPVRTTVDLKDRWRVIHAKDCLDPDPAASPGMVFHHEFLDQTTGSETTDVKSGDPKLPQSSYANGRDENTNHQTAVTVNVYTGNAIAYSPSLGGLQHPGDENGSVLADFEAINSTVNNASVSSMADVQGREALLTRQHFQDIAAGRTRNCLEYQAVTGDMSYRDTNTQKYTGNESPSFEERLNEQGSYRTSEWNGDALNQYYMAQDMNDSSRGYPVDHLLKAPREAEREQLHAPTAHFRGRTIENHSDQPSHSIHWEELATRPLFDFG